MSEKRILLVDDETDFLDIVSQRIESWGYEVIPVSDADEAMIVFKQDKPDAVILDYLMPDINGTQLLMKIRAIDNTVPVIMLTAKPQFETIEDTNELGVSAFIPKLSPYADAQLSLKSALAMLFKK